MYIYYFIYTKNLNMNPDIDFITEVEPNSDRLWCSAVQHTELRRGGRKHCRPALEGAHGPITGESEKPLPLPGQPRCGDAPRFGESFRNTFPFALKRIVETPRFEGRWPTSSYSTETTARHIEFHRFFANSEFTDIGEFTSLTPTRKLLISCNDNPWSPRMKEPADNLTYCIIIIIYHFCIILTIH